MAYENSPSAVMYAELKALGLKKSEAAALLLDTGRSFGGGLLADRVESPSQLTRYIVQTAPGEMSRALFRDFSSSTHEILARVLGKMRRDGLSASEAACLAAARFSGDSAEAMKRALADYGIDASVYRNALAHVASLKLASESDRALLYLMLFVVCGCTGNPSEAAREVERFSESRIGAAFSTTEADWEDFTVPGDADGSGGAGEGGVLLGLMRIEGGKLKGGSLHRLATDAAGSEIGTLAAVPGAITDVDADVSRHHARVYRQGGRWYIVGLKSTNGTSIISGGDKRERVVEPPRGERPRDYEPTPVEILPSDTLCLGVSTRFLVMPLAD